MNLSKCALLTFCNQLTKAFCHCLDVLSDVGKKCKTFWVYAVVFSLDSIIRHLLYTYEYIYNVEELLLVPNNMILCTSCASVMLVPENGNSCVLPVVELSV